MRLKKQKRHRRALSFYSACFGFREPYKVLCDGTFIHHLIANDLLPANDALYRLLGARCILFTTNCIIGELKSLGKSHSEALQAAHKLIVARCDHEKRVSVANCVNEVVGESNNAEHFLVATQDIDLRRKLRELPGTPVIYGLKKSLSIEEPSTKEREYVKSVEKKRLHMGEPDYKKLHTKNSRDTSDNQPTDLPAEHATSGNGILKTHGTRITDTAIRRLDAADKSKFKRKKAKGRNPLSCKKKKPKVNSSVPHNQNGEAAAATKPKRKRKRKRIHKDASHGETVVAS